MSQPNPPRRSLHQLIPSPPGPTHRLCALWSALAPLPPYPRVSRCWMDVDKGSSIMYRRGRAHSTGEGGALTSGGVRFKIGGFVYLMRRGRRCHYAGDALLIDAHGSLAPLGETEPDCMHVYLGHLCNLQERPVASGLPLVSRVSRM
jgi:hypothetical protein